MAQLVSGSRRRLGAQIGGESPSSAEAVWTMGLEVERALRTSVSEIDQALSEAVSAIDLISPARLARLLLQWFDTSVPCRWMARVAHRALRRWSSMLTHHCRPGRRRAES